MNLSRSLYRSFAILLALLLFMVGFSIFNFRRLSDADAWKAHTYAVLQESHRYYRTILEMDSTVRSYILAVSDERPLYYAALKANAQSLERLKFLASDNPQQTAQISAIETAKARWIRKGLEPIIEMRSQTSDPNEAILKGGAMAPARREGLTQVVHEIETFERAEEELLRSRSAEQKQWQTLTQLTLWVGSLFSIFLTGALALVAARSSRQLDAANSRLQHVNRELEATNARINETNQKLAAEVMQRRAAEINLQSAIVELERSNKELGEFAYVASHDLQEPLRAVAGCVQVLKKRYSGQLDARADQFIDHAVDGAQRMQNLIHDLLAYSRVGTRGKEFQLESGEQILDHALRNLATQIAETGVQIERESLPEIFCDAGQLEQLFQNLISNAIKFRGKDTPRVQISYRLDGQEHLFGVQDNGLGMEPQYFERIFVMFQRLHTRSEFPGTGIGLAICKKIVERHNGKIWVESAPGKGSSFFFTIPVKARNNGDN